LDYASDDNWSLLPVLPRRDFLTKEACGCRKEAKWSQSPVLPWTQRAYETCLSAGSTAVFEEMVGTKGAALFASRMSNERSADELHPRKMERVNGVAPSSQPWQSRILLLNHTRQLNEE
jgi:hypothetical protein